MHERYGRLPHSCLNLAMIIQFPPIAALGARQRVHLLRDPLEDPVQGEEPISEVQLNRNLSTTMGHSTGLIREQCPVW